MAQEKTPTPVSPSAEQDEELAAQVQDSAPPVNLEKTPDTTETVKSTAATEVTDTVHAEAVTATEVTGAAEAVATTEVTDTAVKPETVPTADIQKQDDTTSILAAEAGDETMVPTEAVNDAALLAAGVAGVAGAASDTEELEEEEDAPADPPQQHAPPLKPGIAENTFRAMSYLALIFLLVVLGLQTAAGIYFPSAFHPIEVRIIEAYETMIQSAPGWSWVNPQSTTSLSATMPGFFWFMALVDAVPGMNDAFFLPVVASLSAVAALLGVYVLGMCTGLGNRVSFAAGLILLSSLGFVPLTHWVGPEILLAGLLAMAMGCLYRAWVSEFSFWWFSWGFALTGLAALVGGLPVLWIPLISSLLLILWRGTLRRAHRLDAIFGFGLLILLVVGWISAVILRGGDNAHHLKPITEQFITPFLPPYWPLYEQWWQTAALLGIGLLPWILIPLFVSWGRVLATAWPALTASRKERAGVSWLWISLVVGLLLMFTSRSTAWIMAVPVLPMLVLLLAKALLNLSPTSSRIFYLLLSLFCLLAGGVLALTGLPAGMEMLKGHLPAPLAETLLASAGLPLIGGVLLLAALALSRFTNRAYPGGALAVFVLFIVMLVQPATLLTTPSLVGSFAVHLPKGMGVGVASDVLPGFLPIIVKPAQQQPAATPEVPVVTPEPAPITRETQESEAPAPEAAATSATPAPEAPAVPATPETPIPEAPAQPVPAAPETPAPPAVPEPVPATSE